MQLLYPKLNPTSCASKQSSQIQIQFQFHSRETSIIQIQEQNIIDRSVDTGSIDKKYVVGYIVYALDTLKYTKIRFNFHRAIL